MSQYYNPNRTRNLYDPNSTDMFRLSRSKIDLFLNCPRCFYLDRRLGVGRPPGYPFSLNSAVDKLLKKEFDIHRAKSTKHPLMETYGIDAIPLAHEKIDEWRDSLHAGITAHIENTNVVVTGGVDDMWVTPTGEYIVVDYKATSKDGEVSLDSDWQIGYKRQMEIYQWLFRQNGFTVSDTGYFVYCNGNTDKEAFDGKLEFEIKLIPYTGNTDWIAGTILDALNCLTNDVIPIASSDCDFCKYSAAIKQIELSRLGTKGGATNKLKGPEYFKWVVSQRKNRKKGIGSMGPRGPNKVKVNNIMKVKIQEKLHQFDSLTDSEKMVLTKRFGIEDDNFLTLQQTGDFLGISRERIRQIEKRALEKLDIININETK